MKIVYLANSKIPSRTANSIHVMKMCQAFSKNGHTVVLVTPDYADIEPNIKNVYDFYGVEACFKIQKIPYWGQRFKRLNKFLTNVQVQLQKPDLVYARCHGLKLYSLSNLRLPIVFEAHALYKNNRQLSQLVASKHLKRLVVISEGLRQDHQDHYKTSDTILKVVHDAADEPQMVDSLIFSSERLQVGYVGHLYPGKGMEIIAQLAKAIDWADFHVIGGAESDLAYWKQQLKDVPNICFHGFLAPARTDQYRQACDVLLAPYQNSVKVPGGGDVARWMSPLKIFEYMAAGKAILASDLPVLREVLTHKKTALLCSPDDLETWVDSLTHLRDNPDCRRTLGMTARKAFQAHHTWQARSTKVLEGIT